jgi:adsorption protein B
MSENFIYVLFFITITMLFVSGLDDLFMNTAYWLFRGKYKKKLKDFSEINSKPEHPVAIMIGAWREERVIGRTLRIALQKIKYSNYRIFVAVYPNDLDTIRVVREIAKEDHRIIVCLNVEDGPTTKADNLNNTYSCIKEYENYYGEFDVILIHDSEDFIHPLSLKLFNYMINYEGNYGVQIPVVPIKSKLGKLYHRINCDAFAETHTKDMIVRQELGSYIPFAGTGMAFSRKAFLYLESFSKEQDKKIEDINTFLADGVNQKHQPETNYNRLPQYENIAIPGWDNLEKESEDAKYTNFRKYTVISGTVLFLFIVFCVIIWKLEF